MAAEKPHLGTHDMAEITLDLLGLKCPLPALKARKALKSAAPGDIYHVHCDDPLAGIDIPNLLNETGDRLIETLRSDGRFTFVIEKS